jgi:hypothetical protein
MLLKEVIEICDLMDNSSVSGKVVTELFVGFDLPPIHLDTIHGEKSKTDVVRICIPGKNGKTQGGNAPTLGILGTLGGIGARPEILGLVSDADGALVALSAALKLARMHQRGDHCPGDVYIGTHVCPNAPTQPHEPTPFMGSPVSIFDQIKAELHPEMDAVLSVDTTIGNRIINHHGFAISPTDKLRKRVADLLEGDIPSPLHIPNAD